MHQYLLPHKFKRWGWIILIPSLVLGAASLFGDWEPSFLDAHVPAFFLDDFFGQPHLFGWVDNNLLNEIAGVFVLISALMIAFSREQVEDEFIAKVRLESLVWAVYVNYAVLLVAFLCTYDFTFFWIMVLNMFTLLLLFVIRFTVKVAELKKTLGHEE